MPLQLTLPGGILCHAGYCAVWDNHARCDTVRGGIPCHAGYRAVWDTCGAGILCAPCGLGYCAVLVVGLRLTICIVGDSRRRLGDGPRLPAVGQFGLPNRTTRGMDGATGARGMVHVFKARCWTAAHGVRSASIKAAACDRQGAGRKSTWLRHARASLAAPSPAQHGRAACAAVARASDACAVSLAAPPRSSLAASCACCTHPMVRATCAMHHATAHTRRCATAHTRPPKGPQAALYVHLQSVAAVCAPFYWRMCESQSRSGQFGAQRPPGPPRKPKWPRPDRCAESLALASYITCALGALAKCAQTRTRRPATQLTGRWRTLPSLPASTAPSGFGRMAPDTLGISLRPTPKDFSRCYGSTRGRFDIRSCMG